jgi:hypothetical protein
VLNQPAASFALLTRTPKRISITIADGVHRALIQRSIEEGRSLSNLAGFLLETALREKG